MRRIKYFDSERAIQLVFLTNNFLLPALTIANLYKCRWQIELFFKWVKQHLRIKAFYGTSENAVKTQIWIAVSVYVLVPDPPSREGRGNLLKNWYVGWQGNSSSGYHDHPSTPHFLTNLSERETAT